MSTGSAPANLAVAAPAPLPATIPEALRARFGALLDPATWRALAPSLHVGDDDVLAGVHDPVAFDDVLLADIVGRVRDEGYFQLPPIDWRLPMGDLATAVGAVTAAGHMPVFSFMYDEMWLIFTRLSRIISAVLGDTYRMLPAFWAWHVDGKREPAGWQPHRDFGHRSLMPDRGAKALTLWIPLTEATPLNGCMYILPADRDPLYNTTNDNQIQILPQNIRALPSAAGGVLGWNQAVLHWGGRGSARAPAPRISVAVEFQRAGETLHYTPLPNPLVLPTPVERLVLILRQMLQYQHMYPLAPEMKALAEAAALPPQKPSILLGGSIFSQIGR